MSWRLTPAPGILDKWFSSVWKPTGGEREPDSGPQQWRPGHPPPVIPVPAMEAMESRGEGEFPHFGSMRGLFFYRVFRTALFVCFFVCLFRLDIQGDSLSRGTRHQGRLTGSERSPSSEEESSRSLSFPERLLCTSQQHRCVPYLTPLSFMSVSPGPQLSGGRLASGQGNT